jgi:hypothetical protein
MVYSCGQAPATVISAKVTTGEGSQLSVAVEDPVFEGAVLSVHSIVTFAAHVIVGGVLSSIVIVCTQVLVLPQKSVAVHVLVIVYSWGQDPATVTSLKLTTGAEKQLSVAVVVPVFEGSVLSVHSIVTFAAHMVIVGGVLSSIEISCVHEVELPHASVAVQILSIPASQSAPTLKSLKVRTGLGSQLSVAVLIPVLDGSVLSVHSIVTFAAHVIIGGVLSSTVIVWRHVLALPHASVAVQVL